MNIYLRVPASPATQLMERLQNKHAFGYMAVSLG
jgi:hypothetical protein